MKERGGEQDVAAPPEWNRSEETGLADQAFDAASKEGQRRNDAGANRDTQPSQRDEPGNSDIVSGEDSGAGTRAGVSDVSGEAQKIAKRVSTDHSSARPDNVEDADHARPDAFDRSSNADQSKNQQERDAVESDHYRGPTLDGSNRRLKGSVTPGSPERDFRSERRASRDDPERGQKPDLQDVTDLEPGQLDGATPEASAPNPGRIKPGTEVEKDVNLDSAASDDGHLPGGDLPSVEGQETPLASTSSEEFFAESKLTFTSERRKAEELLKESQAKSDAKDQRVASDVGQGGEGALSERSVNTNRRYAENATPADDQRRNDAPLSVTEEEGTIGSTPARSASHAGPPRADQTTRPLAPNDDGSDATPIFRTSQPENSSQTRPDATDTLPPDFPSSGDVVDALVEAAFGAHAQDFRATVAAIWSALPQAAKDGYGKLSIEHEAAQVLSAAELEWEKLGIEDRLLLDMVAQNGVVDRDLPHFVKDLLQLIAPEQMARNALLRLLVVRVGYASGQVPPALRYRLKSILQQLLEAATPDVSSDQATPRIPPNQASQHQLLTAHAGLILFHPYYKMLFSRMDLLTSKDDLLPDQINRAAAVLNALAGVNDLPGPMDPLHRVLLGMPDGMEAPVPDELSAVELDLVDSLIRAVIDQWARLGQTSPAGLQEAFVRRGGSLHFDDTGAHLRVDPGPFDVLLDGLPWSLGPTVALPWMSMPCHIRWRDTDA
ncbi:contractile injection system tape measure protein [uncultured Roseobacter sp.]|uniref:contractile injection system tape measure protein n=1 Tax=uncultured Roseobacter sp. TaxID=114847 RepID=UPI0026393313|nr:contractile injection system tape measure protein [uncultured Roseobacter sp.]